MSLRSRDNVQAKCTELVVIRARMSDLLWVISRAYNSQAKTAFDQGRIREEGMQLTISPMCEQKLHSIYL